MQKSASLEGMRGVAALVVVFLHSSISFLPNYGLANPTFFNPAWTGSPFHILINGAAAVNLFFVLSAYVLTIRYFDQGDARILLRGAFKRWPRLLGPVLLVCFLSYGLSKLDLYYFQAAGRISGSQWLENFATAAGPPEATFATALKQGAFFTFFRGDNWLDTSLWTMRPELLGSFIAFGSAPLLFEARKSSIFAFAIILTLLVMFGHFAEPHYAAFPVGVALAALRNRSHSAWPLWQVVLMGPLCLYLLGYGGVGTGVYAIYSAVPWVESRPVYSHIIGAAGVIFLVEHSQALARLLSGRFFVFLGHLSFPIYLIHFLIICSFWAWVYMSSGPVVAIAAVFLGSVIASLPLIVFNNFWVSQINALTAKCFASSEKRSMADTSGSVSC
jgi:peptidoglycan/LPS O-acetylase OafA/YrhL